MCGVCHCGQGCGGLGVCCWLPEGGDGLCRESFTNSIAYKHSFGSIFANWCLPIACTTCPPLKWNAADTLQWYHSGVHPVRQRSYHVIEKHVWGLLTYGSLPLGGELLPPSLMPCVGASKSAAPATIEGG